MITVFGLWHLGCVTAACCAEHFKTVGLDWDDGTIQNLNQGKAPLLEPGLDDLLKTGLESEMLSFTTDPVQAFAETKLLWVTYDTPVDDQDNADVDFVLQQIRKVVPYLKPDTVVLISSQLPVGSIQQLEQEFPNQKIHFASSPENLRLGKAIDVFKNPGRIIVGVRNETVQNQLQPILEKFSKDLIWMSTESAEMTKHAINSFLALSVTFANELAVLCESVGANAHEVAQGMKSEPRIGSKAYVGPGGAFAGGTLARDIQFLTELGRKHKKDTPLIPAVKQSNDHHKSWVFHKLQEVLGSLSGQKIAVLGLTYKPGTDTLRRSSSVELCKKLSQQGVNVQAFDPSISKTQPELSGIQVMPSAEAACEGADAIVLMTEWPEFKLLNWKMLLASLNKKVVVDQNRFCQGIADIPEKNLIYSSVGVA